MCGVLCDWRARRPVEVCVDGCLLYTSGGKSAQIVNMCLWARACWWCSAGGARWLFNGCPAAVQRAFAFLGGIERLVAGARGQPFMVDSFTPRCPQLLQRLTGTHFRRRGLQYAFDIQHGEPLPAALHVPAFYCTERLAFFNDSYRGLKYRLAAPRQDQLKNRTHFYPKQCESNRNIPTKRMRSVVYAL